MTFECKLKDIRTNADVWEMTGREDYLVCVPALGLVFRYGEEVEMEWNWQDDTEAEGGHVEFIDDLMMVYDENTETWNFTFEGIRKTVRRYIAEHELPIEDPNSIECIIEVNV